MVRYETLFLTIPEFTNDEFTSLESAVNKLIQDEKGVMVSFERWGKYKLAFPVRNNDYGIYGLVRFEVESSFKHSLLKALGDLLTLKYGDSVMRIMTVSLDPKKSLAYHRPESLEEAPVREVDGFFKERGDGMRSRSPRRDSDRMPMSSHDDDEDDDGSEQVKGPGAQFDHRAVAAATPPAEGN
jgi:small subunit ribosomal protein S6